MNTKFKEALGLLRTGTVKKEINGEELSVMIDCSVTVANFAIQAWKMDEPTPEAELKPEPKEDLRINKLVDGINKAYCEIAEVRQVLTINLAKMAEHVGESEEVIVKLEELRRLTNKELESTKNTLKMTEMLDAVMGRN